MQLHSQPIAQHRCDDICAKSRCQRGLPLFRRFTNVPKGCRARSISTFLAT
jgi:hypothetical protein